MSVLTYKDFQGSVSFDEGRLLIKVLHIEDTLLAECESASNAQSVFEELVEEYLETCKEVGKEPCKPYKGSFNVRISPALHRKIAMAAAAREESLNSWVAEALELHLDNDASSGSVKEFSMISEAVRLREERHFQAWGANLGTLDEPTEPVAFRELDALKRLTGVV